MIGLQGGDCVWTAGSGGSGWWEATCGSGGEIGRKKPFFGRQSGRKRRRRCRRRLCGLSCEVPSLSRICFAIAEVLLMICVGMESGHLNDWTKPRSVCHTIRPGLFTAAGILGLIAVFLGFMMYLTALRTQRLHNILGTMHHGDQAHNLAPTAPVEQHQCMPHQHPHGDQVPHGPHNLAPTAPHDCMPDEAPTAEAEIVDCMPDEAPTAEAQTVATSSRFDHV